MKAWFISLVCLVTIAAPSLHAAGTEDEQLAREIAAALRSYPRGTIFDAVGGRVEGGVVTLTGKVTTPLKAREIEAQVARIRGVREVRSQITTLPSSPYDDDLRRRTARAIYGNPAFWRYASMANPPIHILVERGRVTLAGVVHNDVERAMAHSLATGLGELAVVNELRTDRMRD
jgi:hyperosmotically inducible periplasmic protein